METEAPASGATKDIVVRHIPLLSSLLLITYVVLKVYVLAAFRVPVALAILSVTDHVQMLVASAAIVLASVAPWILYTEPVQLAIARGNEEGASIARKVVGALLIMPLSLLVVPLVAPVTVMAFMVLLGVYVVRIRKATRRARRPGAPPQARPGLRPRVNRDTYIWIMTSIVGLTLVTSLATPSTPLELLDLGSGEPTAGYVVGNSNGFTLILDKRRNPSWVRDEEIKSRRICAVSESWFTAPLLSRFLDTVPLARCRG